MEAAPILILRLWVKQLVLQHWFGLSDPELERQVADRISFRIFLGTTEVVPDFSTVWLFRERLIKNGKQADLWRELQRQIDEKGYTVKEGSIQDATFITSDPGRKRKKKDQEAESKKGDKDSEAIGSKQVQEFDKGLLDISNNIINNQEKPIKPDREPTNEGSWAKKGVKSFFRL